MSVASGAAYLNFSLQSGRKIAGDSNVVSVSAVSGRICLANQSRQGLEAADPPLPENANAAGTADATTHKDSALVAWVEFGPAVPAGPGEHESVEYPTSHENRQEGDHWPCSV